MTSQEPEYLFQGFDYLGSLKGQLGDFRSITTLAHELIQNADDAKDDSGNLAATQITFDIRDDVLIVSNDAVFREEDFCRMQKVASYSKRSEPGDPTTGAFGVGFIAVYQFTDRPVIHSAGRRWTLRPEKREHQRIEQYRDPSITRDRGTVFQLPWAFEKSEVREKLGVPQVDRNDIDSFVEELKNSLPKALLFLKKLNTIELLRSGDPVMRVKRVACSNTTRVYVDGVSQNWRIMKGDFCREASQLKDQFPGYIEGNRRDHVRVAIPDSLLDEDEDLLFATLPTEQSTGLPFHINADFFPQRDRKSIIFEDTRTHDYKSQWNRAAIQAAAAAAAVGDNLITLQDMFRDDAPTFWGILARLQRIHREHGDDARIPIGAFWQKLSPSLPNLPVVYTESGKWVTPDQVYVPTSDKENEAVSAFGALGIEIVHRDLLQYYNILRSIGVGLLRIEHIHGALQRMGMVDRIRSDNPLPAGILELLWKGIHGVLEKTQGRTNRVEAERLLKQCALAPGVDRRLWPCGSVYRADKHTRGLFAPLVSRDAASFLAVEGIPLLQRLCSQFGPRSAIKELERPEAQWRNGSFDPAALLRWFDTRNRNSRLTEDLRERLSQLPIFPSEGGHLRPGSLVYRADERTRELFAPLMGHDAAPFLAERVMDISLLEGLCPPFTPRSAIEELECLHSDDFQTKRRDGGFSPAALLRWFDDHKRELTQDLPERLAQLPIFPSKRNLHTLEDLRLPGSFEDTIGVAELLDMGKLGNLRSFLESLGARELTFPDYARNHIPKAFAADSSISRGNKRKLLDILADGIGEIIFNQEIKGRLTAAHIVECSDGEFRQPGTVYLPNNEVKAVLENHVKYALLPRKSERRADLYRRLGVEDRPRVEDILEAIDKQVDRLPNQEAGKKIARILEAVGEAWARLDNVKLLRENLPMWEIIECTDGEFRRPTEIYFPNEEVKAILGDRVSYALLANSHRPILTILGVKDRPRAEDILRAINGLAAQLPDQEARKEMLNILEIIGKGKARYSSLKSKAWLPAEGEYSEWYRPNELYATYNKYLFESQARFLDLSVGVQQTISEFLRYLGVNPSPQPSQVVGHLLRCSKLNRAPPEDIYRWLNDRAGPSDLWRLQGAECLHVKVKGEGKYRRPDQVFRGQHFLGRFRVQLPPDLLQCQNLLAALDVKEVPDHNDAIQVLKEVPGEAGNNILDSEDKAVVLRCWGILADAFPGEGLDAESIREELYNIKCVLNSQDVLQLPSQMFFEDRPGLVDKFPEQLGDKSIPRPEERVWRAMEAAGVRPISEVVRDIVDKPVNPREDDKLGERVAERAPLIRTISDGMTNDGSIPLDSIRFFCTEELKVKWYTDVPNNNQQSLSEAVSAYLNSEEKIIYFTLRNDSTYPWPDIARELAQAIAPGEEVGRISPGLRTVLEPAAYKAALADSSALGIVPTEELEKLESAGAVAESSSEVSPSDGDQAPLTPLWGDPIPGGVTDETSQNETGELAEGGPTPQVVEDGSPAEWTDADLTEHGEPAGLGTPGGGNPGGRQTERRPAGGGRQRPTSFIKVHPDEKEPAPDGSERAARRLEIEESAIDFILECEPDWQRTPMHNRGYDLYKADQDGKVIRWCEVKAMAGSWHGRWVELTHTQFKKAQECREAYWLYVVENTDTSPSIARIRDPAGRASRFTFDHGWREVAV